MFSGFHAAGAELDAAAAGEGCPLEIGVFSDFAGRVEFGSSNTIGVSSGHPRSFIAYWTCFCCHIVDVFTPIVPLCPPMLS